MRVYTSEGIFHEPYTVIVFCLSSKDVNGTSSSPNPHGIPMCKLLPVGSRSVSSTGYTFDWNNWPMFFAQLGDEAPLPDSWGL
jgi:hypothetical protein